MFVLVVADVEENTLMHVGANAPHACKKIVKRVTNPNALWIQR
jgi:hypothetical protein